MFDDDGRTETWDEPVEASPEVIEDLWEKIDHMSSRALAAYARDVHGLMPPEEPPTLDGAGWDIGVEFPDDGPERGVLWWLGPDPDDYYRRPGYGEL